MRRVVRSLAGLALGAALIAPALAATSPAPTSTPGVENPIRVIALVVNGAVVQTDTPPRVEDGRLLVPLRAVLDALGASQQLVNEVIEVDMEPGTSEVIIKRYPMPETVD